jgi:dipeptidyl-peptidase-3
MEVLEKKTLSHVIKYKNETEPSESMMDLLKEVLTRFATLGLKPYKGFIQPKLVPVMKGNEITDVKVIYPTSFFQQMMEYGIG